MTDKSNPAPPDSLPERLLIVSEAADILRLSPRTVRRMIDDGRLPVVRFGRAVRIRPAVLAALLG